MFITHSYLGASCKDYRCLFFLLLEDYIEAQSQILQIFNPYLERFARSLGDSGALVTPFLGDVEVVRQQVLDKSWLESELGEIRKTPSLLMIDKDFDAFDPREHPWIQLHFGYRVSNTEPVLTALKFGDNLTQLAEAVKNSKKDVFNTARDLQHEISLSDAAKLFEAKPGVFGLSVDLFKCADLIRALYHRLGSRD